MRTRSDPRQRCADGDCAGDLDVIDAALSWFTATVPDSDRYYVRAHGRTRPKTGQRHNPRLTLGRVKNRPPTAASTTFTAAVSFASALSAQTPESALEQAVCGPGEFAKFALWSEYAGAANESRLTGVQGVEEVAVTTRDDRTLRGYKLAAAPGADGQSTPDGYVLVVQGNAMLADQILAAFTSFAEAGLDTYIFDYRGYGRSDGQAGLKAILSDYREIIEFLDAKDYATRRFYGMSMGGSVLMNVLQAETGRFRAVIDSAPSRLAHHECPEAYDPATKLPAQAQAYLVIVGLQDRVVPPAMSQALHDDAKSRGASVIVDPEFHHPFQDPVPALHARRMAIVRDFLVED